MPTTTRTDARWFYVGVVSFVILFTLAAFGPSLIDPSHRSVPLPLTPWVLTHTALSIAWLLLFLAQTTLVATGRTRIHRRLGIAGGVIAAALVLTGPLMMIEEARRGFDLSGDLVPRGSSQTAGALLIVVNAFVLFGLLVAGAFWYRRRPDVHKRLMMLAILGPLIGAPLAHVVGHWPVPGFIFPVATIGFLAIQPLHDRVVAGRVHPVSLWGGLLVFAWFNVFFVAIAPTQGWNRFAEWLVR